MKIKRQFLRIIVFRTTLLLVALFILVAVAITKQELDSVREEAKSIGHTVADMLDADELVHYTDTLTKDEAYEETKERLRKLKSNFPQCKYLYIFVPYGDEAVYVYDIYTDAEYATGNIDEGDLGFIDDFTEDFMGSAVEMYETGGEVKNLDIGFNSKYGSLVSYYAPVYNKNGEVKAVIGADYSIQSIVNLVMAILIIMLISFAVFGTFHARYELGAIDKRIIEPIEVIKEKVSEYVLSEHAGDSSKYKIDVKENSENEIDILGGNMNKMMQDMDDLIIKREQEAKDQERISSELNLATRIQASYLPTTFPAFPDRKDFDIYATMNPAKEVGGDFYDYFLVDDTHLALVIADVSGKGVGAALFMMISKTMLNDQTMFMESPADILMSVNNKLCANNEAEMFVTVWLGILNLETGVLKAANAGHEFPTLKKSKGDFELIKDKHGMVLAGMENTKYKEYELQLMPGDRLYVYTDGVAEATDANNQLFGTDRIIESLNKHKDEPLKDMLTDMRKDIDAFVKEAPQFDDITMLTLEYYGKQ